MSERVPKFETQTVSNVSSKIRERSMSLPAACHFNQEIAYYSKQKQYDQALEAYRRMLTSGIMPDVVTYNTMINVFVKSQKLDDAFTLFEQMKSQDIAPSIVTFTSLIDGCGKSNNFTRAMNLYNEVKSHNIELNMHFFNAIMNAALLTGHVSCVDDILQDMWAFNMRPNNVTYNTMISGYSRYGNLRKILSIIKEMKRNKIEFTQTTYSSIINANQLILEQADIKIFIEILRTSEFSPTFAQTTRCIQDLVDKKRLLLAYQLLQTFIELKFNLDINPIILVVRLAGEFANFTVLHWATEYIQTNHIDINFDINAAQLNAYARFGNVEKVQAIYGLLTQNHAQIPIQSKLNSIQCLLNNSDIPLALTIVSHAIEDGQVTGAIADTIILAFFDRNYDHEVIQIFKMIKQNIIQIGPRGSDCVIRSSLKTDFDVDTICQLNPSPDVLVHLASNISIDLVSRIPWTYMIENCKTPPPSATLFELMNALMMKGLHEAAWVAFQHYVKLGVTPSENSIELALQTQRESKNNENLLFLLDAARDNEINPPSELWSDVIISLLTTGNLSMAYFLRIEMDTRNVEMNEQARSLYSMHFESVKHALPTTTFNDFNDTPPKIRTRNRSNTCPKPKTANRWSVMEEISNRSALLALGIDEL